MTQSTTQHARRQCDCCGQTPGIIPVGQWRFCNRCGDDRAVITLDLEPLDNKKEQAQ